MAEGLAQIIPGAQTAEEKLQKEVEELTAKARQTELYHYALVCGPLALVSKAYLPTNARRWNCGSAPRSPV
ncbi:hypothetical protein GCM10025857_68340 [Alicyclobacillus contaminans]|nr:hypothetical protein GCM10025857_68340 [Alicyclobacillus contaminans]